jgi:hypothetical protein
MCQNEDFQRRKVHPPNLEDSPNGLECTDSLMESVSDTESESSLDAHNAASTESSFNAFRLNYLFVILTIMLADGLQGKFGFH